MPDAATRRHFTSICRVQCPSYREHNDANLLGLNFVRTQASSPFPRRLTSATTRNRYTLDTLDVSLVETYAANSVERSSSRLTRIYGNNDRFDVVVFDFLYPSIYTARNNGAYYSARKSMIFTSLTSGSEVKLVKFIFATIYLFRGT